MTVFCDAFALIAWVNQRDAAHARVVEFFKETRSRILTKECVLLETLDALSKPAFRAQSVGLILALRSDAQFDVIPYDRAVFEAGFDLYASRPDKDWSLTDCISFAVMAERNLTEALTADRHFEQAGFRAIFRQN